MTKNIIAPSKSLTLFVLMVDDLLTVDKAVESSPHPDLTDDYELIQYSRSSVQ